MIAHELAHVARFDDAWLHLQMLVQSLFFFHPIVWWTTRAMANERELACDRLVLADGQLSPRRYGQALLRVLGLGLTPSAAVAAVGTKRSLTMRIHQIARWRAGRRPRAATTFVAAAAAACLLLPMAATSDPPAPPEPATPTASEKEVREQMRSALAVLADGPTLDDLMPGARLTSEFGMRRHPIDGVLVHHDGVDLSTGEESQIFAPRGGVVELARERYGENGRMGTAVIIDHGSGVKTFYAHLSRLSVREGDGLSDGDPIGYAGNTGVSAGPHLHFELWKDGEKVDPSRLAEIVGDC